MSQHTSINLKPSRQLKLIHTHPSMNRISILSCRLICRELSDIHLLKLYRIIMIKNISHSFNTLKHSRLFLFAGQGTQEMRMFDSIPEK